MSAFVCSFCSVLYASWSEGCGWLAGQCARGMPVFSSVVFVDDFCVGCAYRICVHARTRARTHTHTHTHTRTQRRQAGNPAHGEALVAGFSQRQKSPQVVMSWSKLRRLKTSRQDWHSFHCVAICTPCNAVCTEPTSPDAGRCYVTKTCPCVLLSMTVRQRSQCHSDAQVQ